jgi:hypothetical protein
LRSSNKPVEADRRSDDADLRTALVEVDHLHEPSRSLNRRVSVELYDQLAGGGGQPRIQLFDDALCSRSIRVKSASRAAARQRRSMSTLPSVGPSSTTTSS